MQPKAKPNGHKIGTILALDQEDKILSQIAANINFLRTAIWSVLTLGEKQDKTKSPGQKFTPSPQDICKRVVLSNEKRFCLYGPDHHH